MEDYNSIFSFIKNLIENNPSNENYLKLMEFYIQKETDIFINYQNNMLKFYKFNSKLNSNNSNKLDFQDQNFKLGNKHK
jgi:hypothetical protein